MSEMLWVREWGVLAWQLWEACPAPSVCNNQSFGGRNQRYESYSWLVGFDLQHVGAQNRGALCASWSQGSLSLQRGQEGDERQWHVSSRAHHAATRHQARRQHGHCSGTQCKQVWGSNHSTFTGVVAPSSWEVAELCAEYSKVRQSCMGFLYLAATYKHWAFGAKAFGQTR